MLSMMAHTLSEDMVEYAGRKEMPTPDADLVGLGVRWRLYETADGWVFLAAPDDDDWKELADVFALPSVLESDERGLTAALEERIRAKTAAEWERELTARDIACVEVVSGPIEEVVMLGGRLGQTLGIVTDQTHPVIGDYSRLAPMVRFSRTQGVAGPAPMCGEHTDRVLAELGYGDERIRKLRESGVIA